MPSITGVSHVALTVTDREASAEWYQRVFGWTVLRRLDAAEAGSPRILLLDPHTFFVLGLCQPEDAARGAFDFRTTGLDHLALGLADEAELSRWRTHLSEQEVMSSPVRDVPGLGQFISFEDPDGIQI